MRKSIARRKTRRPLQGCDENLASIQMRRTSGKRHAPLSRLPPLLQEQALERNIEQA
jgi:hypothetical protein